MIKYQIESTEIDSFANLKQKKQQQTAKRLSCFESITYVKNHANLINKSRLLMSPSFRSKCRSEMCREQKE